MKQEKETQLWQNVHQASKIYLLPNFFTAGNLFFGFLAIILCILGKYSPENDSKMVELLAKYIAQADEVGSSSSGYYLLAILCILASFFCDAFDGRVARSSGKLSLFGKEFDSLADSISFGMAPSLLTFFLILQPVDGLEDYYKNLLQNTGWLIGFLYLLCTVIRLGRFNVLTNPYIVGHEKYEQGDFCGLPSPAAAGAVASIALTLLSFNLEKWTPLLIPVLIIISFLMISNIPYPSFKHINWDTSAKFRSFVMIIACILLIILFRQYSFAIIFLAYIFYAPIKYAPRAIKIFKYKHSRLNKRNKRG